MIQGVVKMLFSVFLANLIVPNSASALDFQDFKTPIIQDLKQSLTPIYEENEYFLELEYEVSVKSFSNQLSGISLAFTYEQKQYPAGCQLLSRYPYPVFAIPYGSNAGKLDSLGQPSGIVSVEKNDGYQIEKHKFKYSTKNLRNSLNTKFKFCNHTLKLEYVTIWDVGGHRNDIRFNHSNYYSDFYNSYPDQSFQTFKELFTGNVINNPVCPSITVPYAWYTSEILYAVCNHSNNLGSLSIVLSPELSDAAKVSSEKAAAEKAAAEKVAADLLAQQNAAAAKIAGTKKLSAITCIKGKLTKKVTAVKPKCPAGYKKK